MKETVDNGPDLPSASDRFHVSPPKCVLSNVSFYLS